MKKFEFQNFSKLQDPFPRNKFCFNIEEKTYSVEIQVYAGKKDIDKTAKLGYYFNKYLSSIDK